MIRALLAAAAVLLATPLFFVALLIAAQTTENAVLSYCAAALVAVLTAAGLARIGNGRRRLTIGASAGLSLALSGGISWAWFGAPVAYTAMPDSPTVRYWDLPTGSRIAYVRIAGRVTHAEPVLLVHGGPGAPPTNNDVFAERLAAVGFAVYNYQQAGAGQSSRLDPSEYTVARHVADLDAIRQQLAAPKVVLIGSSWGGQLTAEYLAAHPDNVAKAIVASPGAMYSNSFSDGSLTPSGQTDQSNQFRAHKRFAATFFLSRLGGLRAAKTLMSDRTADGLYQQFVHSLDMSSGCQAGTEQTRSTEPPAGYSLWVNIATLASAEQSADPRPALRHNTTPLLVLRAQCDYLRWEVTREYRDTFPNAVLLAVNGAGHAVLAQKPEETSAAAIAFLTETALPTKPYTAAGEPWDR
jgi:proline iminopeptidase